MGKDDMMAFQKDSWQDRVPQDWDAHLREKLLQMISGPSSPVVSFPPRKAKRRYTRGALQQDFTVPAPHDARVSNGVRLVMRKKKDRAGTAASLSLTLAGALVCGVIVGGAVAFDRVSAYSQHLIASIGAPEQSDTVIAATVEPQSEELAAILAPVATAIP